MRASSRPGWLVIPSGRRSGSIPGRASNTWTGIGSKPRCAGPSASTPSTRPPSWRLPLRSHGRSLTRSSVSASRRPTPTTAWTDSCPSLHHPRRRGAQRRRPRRRSTRAAGQAVVGPPAGDQSGCRNPVQVPACHSPSSRAMIARGAGPPGPDRAAEAGTGHARARSSVPLDRLGPHEVEGLTVGNVVFAHPTFGPDIAKALVEPGLRWITRHGRPPVVRRSR